MNIPTQSFGFEYHLEEAAHNHSPKPGLVFHPKPVDLDLLRYANSLSWLLCCFRCAWSHDLRSLRASGLDVVNFHARSES